MKNLNKLLKSVDLAIEVIDARFASSTRIPFLEKKMNGKYLIIANKIDLVPKQELPNILSLLKKIKAIPFNSKKDKSNIIIKRIKQIKEKLGLDKVRIFIFGYPNVGKSSLINNLIGKKKTKAAFVPGLTKNIQWIRLEKDVLLLDTPGIIPYKHTEEELALKSGKNSENLKNPFSTAQYIFNQIKNKNRIFDFYSISPSNFNNFLNNLAKRRGFLLKQGELNIDLACRTFINDFQKGKF